MLSSSDPDWWHHHFSALGSGQSGLAFNLTLLLAGLALAACGDDAVSGHRLVPVLRVGSTDSPDLDARLDGSPEGRTQQLVDLLVATIEGRHHPVTRDQHDEGFQITRGLLGTSM